MKQRNLPTGFTIGPTFYAVLWGMPNGVYRTWGVIQGVTFGKRSLCPFTFQELVAQRKVSRQTLSVHVAFLKDHGIIDLVPYRRGDSRRKRIVLLVRTYSTNILDATRKALDEVDARLCQDDNTITKWSACRSKRVRRASQRRVALRRVG